MSLTIKALFHKTEPAVAGTGVFSDSLNPVATSEEAVEGEKGGRRQPPVTPAGRARKGLLNRRRRERRSALTDAGGGRDKATVLDFQEVDGTPIDLLPGDAFLRRRHSHGRPPGHQSATDRKAWPTSKGSGWWCSAVPGSARVPLYADYSARASANDTGPPSKTCDLQFPAMRRLSIATAHAFLLVYSISSLPTFECVKRCFEEVREQRTDFQEVPIVIAGNKLDLAPTRREIPLEDVSEWLFCELPKLRAKVMECSAKDDYNIKDVFRCFVTLSRIVPKNPTGEAEQSGLRRRCSAYGSRRPGSPNGRTGSAGPGNSQQVVAAQGSSVVVTEEVKSKPRSRSLIRRTSRKTKQQLRDARSDDCNIS
ncbi:Uncharacterized protein DBV15_11706 [Temnothorax longispinosus]|uniref:GTP-binding protein Di-Ras2 n=1 Tax=Temnothorax longispinosus TaxID=300112 RepID=A0A4V6RGH5_9HYME|nr:Uncharacterized protein DBV15_11706 [Temnothorax longispinosus]